MKRRAPNSRGGHSPEISESTRFARYVNGLIAGIFDGMQKQRIAQALKITRKTLWTWNQLVDWPAVTEARRRLYAQDILEIDQAMLRGAKTGDVGAAELCYRRFDGYVPSSRMKLEQQTDAELLEEADRLQAEREAKTGPAEANLPRAGAPGAA